MEMFDNKGYYDVSGYDLTESILLGTKMSIRFVSKENKQEGFLIKIENVIAFSDRINCKAISLLRIDEDGSSFGIDVATRLSDDKFTSFKLLYLFEDLDHSSVVLRLLAENISIIKLKIGFENWPY